jgi:hypothetical protein
MNKINIAFRGVAKLDILAGFFLVHRSKYKFVLSEGTFCLWRTIEAGTDVRVADPH